MTGKNVEDFYPLSPMQQGMLFHSLLAPESGVYVEQMRCTLRGDLDVEAFRRAWQEVMTRHAILRTAFVGEKLKEPVQVVYRQLPVPLEVVDWRHVSAGEQTARLAERAAKERLRGFNPARPPLMRLTLSRTTDDTYDFLWTYHHILLDGWSQPRLYHEVFTLYDGYVRGERVALPPSPSYRDYIVWLKQQDLDAAEAYWRRTLKGFTSPTPLVIPSTPDATESQSGGELELGLSVETTTALRSFAGRHGVTLNTLVQGAWALLLSRYSGEHDIIFGVTVSGRPADLPDSDAMVGLFINTLPLRVEVIEHAIVRDWLKGLQAQQGELHQYQYAPLVRIHNWSEVPGSESLFETILVFENYPVDITQQAPALTLQLENVQSVEQTNYPITAVAGAADELVLKIVFDNQRFGDETIRRMLGHWATLLKALMTHVDRDVAALPILAEAERQQLLVDWQATDVDFPEDQPIHKLFEAQVDRTPEIDAVSFMESALTYRELDQWANQVAHYLLSQGVGPEMIVGICVERSLEMLIGLWGIFKTGAAYLPLDPAYPSYRLAHMLEDTQAPVVLTQQALLDRLPVDDPPVICLDRDWDLIARMSPARPMVEVALSNLAYVIYTSGSTGLPKGTLLEHRGLMNLVTAWRDITDLEAGSQVLQFFAYGFDGSILDLFPGLLVGATVHLVPEEMMLQPEILAGYMHARAITHVNMTPSMLAMLPQADYPSLETVMVGGEVCPRELVARWVPGRRFVNAYGPTEATVAASYCKLTELSDTLATIPIGRPLPNVRLYVLDEQERPVPIGVPGELYIGGVGVARGYLNRPRLSEERFVPDPFSSHRGNRLYRTGDLVRYVDSGDLEFLGRIDTQVKLRGFRVELGEVEAVLMQNAGVRQAVVALHDAHSESARLVAYVVSEEPETLDVQALREGVAAKLPSYMAPSAYVVLEALPLNASGKVDRDALPDPGAPVPATGEPLVPPRDALELQLVHIWEEILGVESVGVKDDFFKLGGHSLLAMRLIAVIQEQMHVNVPIIALFQEPTIERLASVIRRQDGQAAASSLVPIQPKGDNPPLFFVHPSGGSVHWYADLSRHLGRDWPFYGLQARGLQGDAEIHTRIEDMASHYIRTMRSVQPTGPYFLGSWSMGVMVAFEMAQQLEAAGEEVKLLALLDQGPVLPHDEPEDDAAYLVDTFGKHVPLDLEALRQLDAQAQVEHVWQKAREANWLYPDVTLVQFSHFLRLLRTHTEAWRAYTPKPYPGRVTVFRARRQADGAPDSPDLGWSELALKGVEVVDTPGDHLSMIHNPRARILARKLCDVLQELNGG